MTTYRIGRDNPGWTYQRRACVWEGCVSTSYIWKRSPWRVSTVWIATALVFGLLVWGCIHG